MNLLKKASSRLLVMWYAYSINLSKSVTDCKSLAVKFNNAKFKHFTTHVVLEQFLCIYSEKSNISELYECYTLFLLHFSVVVWCPAMGNIH